MAARKRRGRVAAGDAVDHGFDGHHLAAALGREVDVVIAPPVPAAVRVGGGGGRLRVEDDDFIGVGPAVVAGVLIKRGADGGDVLLAAVEGHVQFAGLAGGAGGGHIGVAGAGHAVGGGIEIAPERRLVEIDEGAAQGADVLGGERAVQPFENLAGGVEVAVVDVGAAVDAAGVAEIIGRHRMFGGQIVFIADVGGGDVVAVHGFQIVHHRLLDGRIERAGKQVDLRCAQVGGRIDVAVAGPGVDHRDQVGQIARAGIGHAGTGGDQHIALRAVDRPAGDDARALFDRFGIRHVHLRGHVGAG